MEPRIQAGEIWTHIKNKNQYKISVIANENNGKDDDNNPPIVVYHQVDTFGNQVGPVYARLLERWRNSFVHPDEKPIGRGG